MIESIYQRMKKRMAKIQKNKKNIKTNLRNFLHILGTQIHYELRIIVNPNHYLGYSNLFFSLNQLKFITFNVYFIYFIYLYYCCTDVNF